MKTTISSLLCVASAATAILVMSLAFTGCNSTTGGFKGNIGLGRLGQITSGTLDIDLGPFVDDKLGYAARQPSLQYMPFDPQTGQPRPQTLEK